MKFDILTLFPEMIDGFLSRSILGRAVKGGIIDIKCTNIRDFANDKHNRVDDYPFGGGLGMVMRPQPVFDTYNYVSKDSEHKPYTIYMSPKGKVFNQEIAKTMATKEHIVIICGHYEGIDQRVIDEICDEEISIGDFVLTGGEIAACVVCDAVARLVPGVLSENGSFELESHYNGLLEQPQYTRPRVFNGIEVPEVLLSGNDKKIKEWETERSIELTMDVRPDLCEKKGIEVTEKPIPYTNAKIKVLALGNNEATKKLETVKMHCDKKGLRTLDFEVLADNQSLNLSGFDGIFVVACSECEQPEIQADIPKLMCGYLSDTKNNADIFALLPINDFDVTEKMFLSASEIADEVFDFCIACGYKNNDAKSLLKHISGKESYSLVIKNNIPYDLFENHSKKFEDYKHEDVFAVLTDKTIENGGITAVCKNGRNSFIAQGGIFKLKSKKYGKIYAFAAKGLGKFVRYALFENNINSMDFVCGNYMCVAYKTLKTQNDGEVVCCSEKTAYKSENPFE